MDSCSSGYCSVPQPSGLELHVRAEKLVNQELGQELICIPVGFDDYPDYYEAYFEEGGFPLFHCLHKMFCNCNRNHSGILE